MSEKILSLDEITECRNLTSGLLGAIDEYKANLDKLKAVLTEEDIVQTFFESGRLGEDIRAKLDSISDVIRQSIPAFEKLSSSTTSFLDDQDDRQNRSVGGN